MGGDQSKQQQQQRQRDMRSVEDSGPPQYRDASALDVLGGHGADTPVVQPLSAAEKDNVINIHTAPVTHEDLDDDLQALMQLPDFSVLLKKDSGIFTDLFTDPYLVQRNEDLGVIDPAPILELCKAYHYFGTRASEHISLKQNIVEQQMHNVDLLCANSADIFVARTQEMKMACEAFQEVDQIRSEVEKLTATLQSVVNHAEHLARLLPTDSLEPISSILAIDPPQPTAATSVDGDPREPASGADTQVAQGRDLDPVPSMSYYQVEEEAANIAVVDTGDETPGPEEGEGASTEVAAASGADPLAATGSTANTELTTTTAVAAAKEEVPSPAEAREPKGDSTTSVDTNTDPHTNDDDDDEGEKEEEEDKDSQGGNGDQAPVGNEDEPAGLFQDAAGAQESPPPHTTTTTTTTSDAGDIDDNLETGLVPSNTATDPSATPATDAEEEPDITQDSSSTKQPSTPVNDADDHSDDTPPADDGVGVVQDDAEGSAASPPDPAYEDGVTSTPVTSDHPARANDDSIAEHKPKPSGGGAKNKKKKKKKKK